MTRTRSLAALLILAGLPALSAQGETPGVSPEALGLDGRQLDYIDEAVEKEIAANNLPGCVVAIGRTGGHIQGTHRPHETYGSHGRSLAFTPTDRPQ